MTRVSGKVDGDHVFWDPAAGLIDAGALAGLDGVVHLAGENIADGRWTAAKKDRIRRSRIDGTRLLAETLAGLKERPRVMVSGSAIGYYGDRGDEIMTESSPAGTGFLAEVCADWESATIAASNAGIRVCNLRTGVVLSRDGGALQKMIPAFQMGAGGKLGSGKQWMSWIALEDEVGAIMHCLTNQAVSCAVNAVAPNAVTNSEFTAALGAALHRPTIMPVPGMAVHLLLGEMADELLLASTRVAPSVLLTSGYKFKYPNLREYLATLMEARKPAA
jgi:uncharacterized protein (TIGR01777 family)